MIWMKALLGALGIGGDYLQAKAKLKQTKVESATKIEEKKVDHEAHWETTHAKGSMTSWKDEFWTIIWSIPVIMCFIPGGVVYAKAGFAALAEMPEWYTYTLVTIVLASFGIRFGGTLKAKYDEWKKPS